MSDRSERITQFIEQHAGKGRGNPDPGATEDLPTLEKFRAALLEVGQVGHWLNEAPSDGVRAGSMDMIQDMAAEALIVWSRTPPFTSPPPDAVDRRMARELMVIFACAEQVISPAGPDSMRDDSLAVDVVIEAALNILDYARGLAEKDGAA